MTNGFVTPPGTLIVMHLLEPVALIIHAIILSADDMAAVQCIKACRYRSRASVINDTRNCPVSNSPAGESALLMCEVRGEWPD